MTCVGRFSEAWGFAAFFCTSGGYANGINTTAGLGMPTLTDPQMDFIRMGVQPNMGMLLYNVTKNTSGGVTVVTTTTLQATGVLWDLGDEYRIAALTTQQRSTIEVYLDMTAADIHAAMAAQNACNCTLQSWVVQYLAKINIIEASAFYTCPCAKPNLSDERQQNFVEWAERQLIQIRDGEIVLCEGDTGKNYPAVGTIQYSHTPWTAEEIINNNLASLP
jgi:hypothetical protein